MKKLVAAVILLAGVLYAVSIARQSFIPAAAWTDDEVAILRSLWLESLPALAPDPSNAVADNPVAASFGRELFFDRRLSANGGISCATCHQEERRFTDGLKKGQAIGTTDRHTPSIVGSAYSPWQFWDGRSDSQWAQALAPLVHPDEHATTREQVAAVIAADERYRDFYATLFGEFPDLADADEEKITRVFVNVGKSIAAFERTVMPSASRFDQYIREIVVADSTTRASDTLSDDEVRGLRLFIGEAQCLRCHNGPLLTNHEFHNTGLLSAPGEIPDIGRSQGVRLVLQDEFNCRGVYSDDPSRQCAELDFVQTGIELIGATKTPSLRNLENTAPYMHNGEIETIAEVLRHYNDGLDAMIGHNEAEPLGLSRRELQQLEAFLATLSAPVSQLR